MSQPLANLTILFSTAEARLYSRQHDPILSSPIIKHNRMLEAKNMRMIQLLTPASSPATLSSGAAWSEDDWGHCMGAIFALAFAVGGNQTCLLFAVVVQPLLISLVLADADFSRKKDMKGLTNCDWQACVGRPSVRSPRGNEYVNGIKRGGEGGGGGGGGGGR